MKTFFITWTILQGVVILLTLLLLIFHKPSPFSRQGNNRISKNWHEIKYLFWSASVLALVIALGATKIILWFNFLEANS